MDILKDFFESFSIKERKKVVRIVLSLKPENYTVLEFNQLLSDVAEWVRNTRPVLVDMFIEKEITCLERRSITEGGEGVTLGERQDLIDLLRSFIEITKNHGYEIGNNYTKIYLETGEVAAQRFLKIL